MVGEIKEWLEMLGLAKYAGVFAETGIDLAGIEIALVLGDGSAWIVG